MSESDVPPLPETTPKAEAHERMRAAGFDRLFLNVQTAPTKCEMWKNRHGKPVNIYYTDDTFEHFWSESLENALQERETRPKDPFAEILATLLSKGPAPD
jgi:hypothetical protein